MPRARRTTRRRARARGATAAVAAAAAAALGGATASPAAAEPPGAQTVLISRTPAGAPANGPSANPVISQDQRFARVVAFESAASDIAPGATAGISNVYVATRAQPYGDNGTPWGFAQAQLISRGLDGQPADGPSRLPAVDGSSGTAPSCAAFVSAATNLVPGDTNGVADAFVASLSTGEITRVSVSASGAQANGPTTQVAVDGRCTRVAFTSTATNLALTRTSRPSWKSARTTSGGGRRQVYVRAIGGTDAHERALRGLTFLASARGGRAGDGDSFDPVLSSRGRSLAFTTRARSLGGGPPPGVSQIYLRRLDRRTRPERAGGRRVQGLRLTTVLVSAAAGKPGDGPSADPAINAAEDTLAYQTRATNLAEGNRAGIPQIIRTKVAGAARKHAWMSSRGGRLGDRPSREPTMTDDGHWVFFTTEAPDLRPPGDLGQAPEILFNAFPWVVSSGPDDRPLTAGAAHPDTSPQGNYVVFDSGGLVLLRYLGRR
jgi:hypothetical protein